MSESYFIMRLISTCVYFSDFTVDMLHCRNIINYFLSVCHSVIDLPLSSNVLNPWESHIKPFNSLNEECC